MVCSFLALPCVMQAQDDVTNAFDDLKRQGTVNEQDSEMRRVASSDAVKTGKPGSRLLLFYRRPGTRYPYDGCNPCALGGTVGRFTYKVPGRLSSG